ncbi:hypothetical protein TcCL_Unassigned04600, partial [Trypanosoma cruzi]
CCRRGGAVVHESFPSNYYTHGSSFVVLLALVPLCGGEYFSFCFSLGERRGGACGAGGAMTVTERRCVLPAMGELRVIAATRIHERMVVTLEPQAEEEGAEQP